MAPLSPAHLAFGAALRAIREEKQIAQESLALQASVDRSHLSEIERGAASVGLQTVLKLCSVLGIEPSELFSRAEDLGLTAPSAEKPRA